MIIQIIIGLIGLFFHSQTILNNPMSSFFETIIYNAPIFAPLLFVNLAVLAILGLIDIRFKIEMNL